MHDKLMELLIHYDTALPSVMSVFRGRDSNLLLALPFSKKEQNQWCQVTEVPVCQTPSMVSVAYG